MEEIKALLKALVASNSMDKEKEDDKLKEEREKKELAQNEDVDKRKLIDEVAGIMKSAGADDELIRTAIAKMEKLGYDKSEAGTADNKCKNEEDEEDSKKGEEDVKAKNSIADQMKVFVGSSVKSEPLYISQAKAIELGRELY